MNEKASPTTAGKTVLREVDLEQVRGGGTTPHSFRVEINGIGRGAPKSAGKTAT